MKFFPFSFLVFYTYISVVYSQTQTVTTNADSGSGSLRQAMLDINTGSDSSNTINMEVSGNSPITINSDLPLTKKNTVINSSGKQPIDGQGQYRLFATIMADLTINDCILQNGAAIGGNANFTAGGGLGAGGGIYIDRGNVLNLMSTDISACQAKGGNSSGGKIGGGASFSDGTKDNGGDYIGTATAGGAYDGSPFLTGYGGGKGDVIGGGNGAGEDASGSVGGKGGYCGGGGSNYSNGGCGGGGNGGGVSYGGGFGSGGNFFAFGSGGGFGGGGANHSGGGFGAGGGRYSAKGGFYGGNGNRSTGVGGGGQVLAEPSLLETQLPVL